MFENFFADPGVLLLGGLTGLVFGFVLQKGGVTRFSVIVGQFLLKDFTMLKIMLTAIVVGGLGIYGMRAAGLEIALHVKTAALLGNALGGVIFGIGMALLGFCPGTGVAAIGDGAKHAIPGVAGMVAGAAVYAEVYPWFKANILDVGAMGKATLASVTGLSPWWLMAAVLVMAAGIVFALERFEHKRASAH
jgi:hypothetical protein